MINLYSLMAGSTPKPMTGGDFKLLYGNREKIKKATGLAIWSFDDKKVKLENVQFTETLENKKTGYVQTQDPHGGEFKFIYGNREKVKLASSKSSFIFGEIADRPTIVGAMIHEEVHGTCDFLVNTPGCVSKSVHTITSSVDKEDFTYSWKVILGNATITNDITSAECKVEVPQSDTEAPFTLECTIIDNMEAQVIVTQIFTHTRVEVQPVSVDTVVETSNISCSFGSPIKYNCEARSTYTITTTDSVGVKIVYEIKNGNAYIISGQGTKTVTIGTRGRNTTENFTLGVTVSDKFSSDYKEAIFAHTRVQVAAITVGSITESNTGSCMLEQSQSNTCRVESTYTATNSEPGTSLTKIWTTGNANVIITSGQGTNTVTVESAEHNLNTNFKMKFEVFDEYTSATSELATAHIRTIRAAKVVMSLVEGANLGCVYDTAPGSVCRAVSSYAITTNDNGLPETILWTISGNATITSGQGTKTIVVESNGNNTENFTVSATASDTYSSKTSSIETSHVKSIRIPVDIMSINEKIVGSCVIGTGDTKCITTSRYGMTTGPIDYDKATVLWVVVGNGTIIGQNNEVEVVVQTDSSINEGFTLEVAINDTHTSDTKSQAFTHTRAKEIVIASLTESTSGSCSWETNKTCVSTSEYTISATNADTYVWEVTGATIASGQGTNTITVTTTSNVSDAFNVKCTASNSVDSKSINNNFTHTRVEIPVHPIVIASIIEVTTGSCSWLTDNLTCVATSKHTVASTNGKTITWSVPNGVTIVSGQGTATVEVSTSGSSNSIFNLTCTVSNEQYSESMIKQVTHARVEITDPVAITSLTESVAGHCDYSNGGICVANGAYTVVATDAQSYVWSVSSGATIIEDNGTSIVVKTISNVNTEITVTCEVHGFNSGVVTQSIVSTHTRAESGDMADTAEVYNETNIAQEFV